MINLFPCTDCIIMMTCNKFCDKVKFKHIYGTNMMNYFNEHKKCLFCGYDKFNISEISLKIGIKPLIHIRCINCKMIYSLHAEYKQKYIIYILYKTGKIASVNHTNTHKVIKTYKLNFENIEFDYKQIIETLKGRHKEENIII